MFGAPCFSQWGSPRTLAHTLCVQSLVSIDLVGEGVPQGQGCKEHLHTDDEVLVAAATVPSPTDTRAEWILGMAPHFSRMARSMPG